MSHLCHYQEFGAELFLVDLSTAYMDSIVDLSIIVNYKAW